MIGPSTTNSNILSNTPEQLDSIKKWRHISKENKVLALATHFRKGTKTTFEESNLFWSWRDCWTDLDDEDESEVETKIEEHSKNYQVEKNRQTILAPNSRKKLNKLGKIQKY